MPKKNRAASAAFASGPTLTPQHAELSIGTRQVVTGAGFVGDVPVLLDHGHAAQYATPDASGGFVAEIDYDYTGPGNAAVRAMTKASPAEDWVEVARASWVVV